MIRFYTIQLDIEDEDKLPWGCWSEIYELGKEGRLCKSENGLKLNSLELAERFKKRYIHFLKNKYGNDTKAFVRKYEYQATPVYGPKYLKLIEINSYICKKCTRKSKATQNNQKKDY